jgi:Cys-tRNA(Pro)/Cys-tRNA(Cys) deacylase
VTGRTWKNRPRAGETGGSACPTKTGQAETACPTSLAGYDGIQEIPIATPAKTNAARLLDQAGVRYELRHYPVVEEHLSALQVAEAIGMPPEQVFKTLVARGDRTGVVLACIPANTELDLKALAAASGNKKVELVPVKEVLGLTGYIRGGVSPVGTKRPYPLYLDETAELWDVISVSAGIRGCQMLLCPADLTRVVDALPCPIAIF